MNTDPLPETIQRLERPDSALWTYYVIRAIATGPGVFFTLPYLYFRYHTLRYRFDAEGIHMRVGILFRREINLTYARIQDIHLRSGIVQRWLGLANLQVQTASGGGGPELVIEGFKEFEMIRDFLYTRMRGYRLAGNGETSPARSTSDTTASAPTSGSQDVVELLAGIRDELRRTRQLIEARETSAKPIQPGAPRHV